MIPLHHRWLTHGRVLILPLLLWGLVVGTLWEPVLDWLSSGKAQDETILREWIDEARGNLPAMTEDYLRKLRHARTRNPDEDPNASEEVIHARDKILEFLDTLGTPPTKMYSGTLPLFPTIYRIAIVFKNGSASDIVWDSLLPIRSSDCDELEHSLGPGAEVRVRYQLHAYDKRQAKEAQRADRVRQLGLLAIITTAVAFAWVLYIQRRERERQQAQQLAEQQLGQAERRQQEAERGLLQQRLAAQEYEQKMLEMKSQLYAGIGIMAGSYAHNIKNLLVRPNDLLRRCLEADGVTPEQASMLQEVRQTLGMVTERLQQILQTVRRDPTQSEMGRLDLRDVLTGLERTWGGLAWDRWKLQLRVHMSEEPLWIDGDLSHLQQAVENLLFNARDATFEMRLHLRDEARKADLSEPARRQALIAAAAWKGQITIEAGKEGDRVVLEVRDNGAGMNDEVRRRCTETHFSTKRDNAGYEGHSTGMGLGLSFVQMVLDNHQARLDIESAPLQGAVFRVRFPAAPPLAAQHD